MVIRSAHTNCAATTVCAWSEDRFCRVARRKVVFGRNSAHLRTLFSLQPYLCSDSKTVFGSPIEADRQRACGTGHVTAEQSVCSLAGLWKHIDAAVAIGACRAAGHHVCLSPVTELESVSRPDTHHQRDFGKY
jgi:hypothetical protein